MSAERLEELFGEAIEHPPSERMAFLERACDPELLPRLKAMIETHVRAERLAFFTPKTPFPGTEQPGQRIGPYLLREQLGEGGWGVVFLAGQEKPVRRRVALKVIKAGLDTRNVIARFEAEREALARMDHPNIAKVLDAGATEAGRPYFVMELVSGPRITEYCDQKKLRISDRLELFAKVCQAVQHAHQKGIIHRDLKPSNILVAEHDGMPVPNIIDFGIAKATEGRLTDYTTGGPHLMGTPAYMSPEQTAGSSPDVDTRSDIYSLGVLLYELLVGKTPFDSKKLQECTWEEMCRTIREKDPLRPSALLATLSENERSVVAVDRGTDGPHLAHRVSGDLDWIVMKCLEKERARRYEAANSLAMDVRRHLVTEPVLARPPSATYRLQRLMVRNKLAFAAIGAVAIALVVGLTAALLGWRAARTERDNAVHARQEMETARAGEASQRQRAERNLYAADMNLAAHALAATNRGRALELLGLYRPRAGQEDLRGWKWRYLWKLCQGEERFTLPGHPYRVVALAFSPDSKTLFSGGGDVVQIWDLASLEEPATLRIDTAPINVVVSSPTNQNVFIGWLDAAFITALAISTNGQTLIIGSFGGVAVRDGPSFASETERRLPEATFPLALSPDDQTLVTGGTGTNGVIIWDTANWKRLHTLGQRSGLGVTFSPDGTVAMLIESGGAYEVMLWNIDLLRAGGARARPASVLQRGTNKFGFFDVIAFSKDGQILATGTHRGLQLWDPKTGLPLSKPDSSVEFSGGGLLFLPDGKTLLTHKGEQDFHVWDISRRTNIVSVGSIPGHLNEIWSLVLAPNGQTLASGSKDGTVKLWRPDVFQERLGVKDQLHGHRIEQVVFSKDGGMMFTISSNRSFGTWETATLQPRTSYELPRDVRIAVISPQGNQVAAGLTNGAVQVWSVPSREQAPRLRRDLLPAPPSVSEPLFVARRNKGQEAAFPLVTWSADGERLAAYVNELHLWDAATDKLVRKLPLGDELYSIALSPNGKILAAGIDKDIELWDLTTGKKLSTCVGHREYTMELTFSPDGKTLASANIDNTAALWEVPSGKRKFRLTSHTFAIAHLAFSPDGRTLATRGAESVVKLWNVETGRELLTIGLPGSNGWGSYFSGVRFSPDGSLLAAGIFAPEPHIRFYRAPSLAVIDAAEAHNAGKQ